MQSNNARFIFIDSCLPLQIHGNMGMHQSCNKVASKLHHFRTASRDCLSAQKELAVKPTLSNKILLIIALIYIHICIHFNSFSHEIILCLSGQCSREFRKLSVALKCCQPHGGQQNEYIEHHCKNIRTEYRRMDSEAFTISQPKFIPRIVRSAYPSDISRLVIQRIQLIHNSLYICHRHMTAEADRSAQRRVYQSGISHLF